MAAGDVINPSRPRYETNERFDTTDAEAASASPRSHLTALTRAALSTPVAASALPTGMILAGFGLTLNPTGGSDGKVRIQSALGVALDADGNLLIKPDGTQLDVTIPSGTYQLYIYFTEVPTSIATRYKISATSPYTESPDTMETEFKGSIGTYVRSGTAASIIAEDAVNGKTVSLCCLGVVTNSVGAITCSGYDATNAPNGSDITNRLATVTAHTTPGTYTTKHGSMLTLHDLILAGLYQQGRTTFLGAKTTLIAYTGTSTSVGTNTLNDTGAAWVIDELIGCVLKDSAGTYFDIADNTATSITTASGDPASGAYTVYGPASSNNFGAWTPPSRSLQAMNERFDSVFDADLNLELPNTKAAFLDSASNRRQIRDAYGMPAGRISSIYRDWHTADQNCSLTSANGGSALGGILFGSTLVAGSTGATLTTSASAGSWAKASLGTWLCQGPLPAHGLLTVEWEVDSTVLIGTPALYLTMGLFTDVTDLTNSCVGFYKDDGDTDWQIVHNNDGGGATMIDTGLAVAAYHRFRIVGIGSGRPGGGRWLVYIDGTLYATITGTEIPNNSLTMGHYLSTSSVAGTVRITGFNFSFARNLTDDDL